MSDGEGPPGDDALDRADEGTRYLGVRDRTVAGERRVVVRRVLQHVRGDDVQTDPPRGLPRLLPRRAQTKGPGAGRPLETGGGVERACRWTVLIDRQSDH